MNPITNMKNLNKMNEREIEMGVAGTHKSWHNQYKDSAWIFAGGLPYDLTEGDIICVFSECGEIVHINLVRDTKTGKSKGFAFICYEDQRSTILAVDNLNGMKLVGRLVRVDHVETYKLPKDLEKLDADRKKLMLEGCAPKPMEVPVDVKEEDSDDGLIPYEKAKKKHKKEKKEKKKRKKKKRESSSSSESNNSSDDSESKRKRVSSKASKKHRSRSRDRFQSSKRGHSRSPSSSSRHHRHSKDLKSRRHY